MTTAAAAANRKYFDDISSSYDSKPWFAKVNSQVTDALRSNLPWIGIPFVGESGGDEGEKEEVKKEVKLLDYACGTGLMTRVFGPYVTTTLAIDISPNMVSTYNARAHSLAHLPMHAVVGDLFDKSDPTPDAFSGPEWWGFDLAAVGFGFHHFEDVAYAAGRLGERLRPGGVLVINDFLEGGDYLVEEVGGGVDEGSRGVHHGDVHVHEHGEHHHHHHHHQNQDPTPSNHDINDTSPTFIKKMNDSIIVPHFTIEGVKKFFAEAGFVDVDVKTMEKKAYMEFAGKKMWRTVLFARGRRPLEGGSGL